MVVTSLTVIPDKENDESMWCFDTEVGVDCLHDIKSMSNFLTRVKPPPKKGLVKQRLPTNSVYMKQSAQT